MKNQFLDKIKSLFENKEKLNQEQLQQLMVETAEYFASLNEKTQSGAHEEAMASAMELKSYLESQLPQLASFMSQGLSEEEQAVLHSFNEAHSSAKKTNKLKPIKMS